MNAEKSRWNALDALWQFPVDVELWLILAYVAGVLIAHVIEALAKTHYARGRRYAEHGFEYVGAAINIIVWAARR